MKVLSHLQSTIGLLIYVSLCVKGQIDFVCSTMYKFYFLIVLRHWSHHALAQCSLKQIETDCDICSSGGVWLQR